MSERPIAPVPDRLYRSWLLAAAAAVLLATLLFWLMSRFLSVPLAIRGAAASSAVLLFLLFYLRSHLPGNRRADFSAVLPTLGAANTLTLFRGYLVAVLAGFAIVPERQGWTSWLPGILFLTIALTDAVDGFVARRTQRITELGKRLDTSVDALSVLVACVLGIHYGRLPFWFLIVGLTYYLFVGAIFTRRHLELPVAGLPPSAHRRLAAGMLFGYLSVALFPVFGPPATNFAAALFAAPVLGGFVRDFLVATTQIDTASLAYLSFRRRLRCILLHSTPPLVRVITGLAVAAMVVQYLAPSPAGRSPGAGDQAFNLAGMMVAATAVLGTVSILAGWLTRTGTLLIIAAVALVIHLSEFTVTSAVALSGATFLLYAGPGRFASWTPEGRLLGMDMTSDCLSTIDR